MNWQNVLRILKSDYLKLLPIMALAFYLAFIPHNSYLYPVHLDEWIHLCCSNQVISQGTIVGLVNPWSGGAPNENQIYEFGFHVFWGIFHQISGLSWLIIYKYFPSIIFLMTVLSVYVLAQREGFGWEAALFTCLITTTVGILGPGFLVPVAMGLLFVPLILFIALNLRSLWSYLVLFILMCFLVSLHPATAVNAALVLAPFILLNLKSNFKHSVGITLAVAIPFLAPFPKVFHLLLPTFKELFTQYTGPAFGGIVDLPKIITTYGQLPVVLCILGVFLLAIKGRVKNYSLVLGLLALLFMLVAYFTFHYGVGILYARGLLLLMLMMSIFAGIGLTGVKNLKVPTRLSDRLKIPLITKNVGKFLCITLIIVTLTLAIPTRQHIPYYHMIDDEDYQAFVWIKENINESYDKAILDPWKGTAFTAITGKNIYTWIGAAPQSTDLQAYQFLQNGCDNTTFLKENSISIVYTRWEVKNTDLTKVRDNVYLLK